MQKEPLKLVIGITAPASVGLIRGQLKYFSEKGYKVYLLAPKDEKTIAYCERENCTLLPVNIKREISLWHDLKAFFVITNYFLKIKPDIVNVGTPKVSLLGMIAAKICGVKKRIYTCRGFRYESETGKLKKLLVSFEKIIARYSHKIVCISESVKTLGERDGIFKGNKTIVIGHGSSNGLDLSLFAPGRVTEEKKLQLRIKYKIKNKYTYGFLGRLVDRKGINELYTAFDELYHEDPDIRLLMVGSVEKQQIADKDLIAKYNNHPGIIMVGKVPFEEVPAHMALMDCFVLPAWWEGFGNVLIQAAAMGIPIISTHSTGCSNAVSDGYNGVLVKPIKNVKVIKEAMDNMRGNKEEAAVYGDNGIQWARNFEPIIIWQGLEKIYNESENL